jgi:hypothetical protein
MVNPGASFRIEDDAIVEEVCAAHGWEVTLADAKTGGARFEIGSVEQR